MLRRDEGLEVELRVNGRAAFVATGRHDMDPEAKTVVFVHGVGQDHTVWVLPKRYFARHGRNVVSVDLPGHGRSEGPPLDSIETMADWVIEVLDSLSVDTASLVGHSMGSLVALDAAARNPYRVVSLVMVGVSVPLAVSTELMGAADSEGHDALDMLTYWGHSRHAWFGGNETPGIWMTGAYMRLLERCPPGTIAADLSACDSYLGGLIAARSVRAPTLVLMGSRDVMTPPRGAQEMIGELTDVRTVVFEGAGHALLTERPDQVLDELIEAI